MKVEIILMIVWTSVCLCERKQRSTVLTDESKRIVEQFDFSNFDKQEGLNYIDRQRFDNQIRGKRSHTTFKRDPKGFNRNIQTDFAFRQRVLPNTNEDLNTDELNTDELNTDELNTDIPEEVYENDISESPEVVTESQLKQIEKPSRNRRGRRLKKKRKYKDSVFEQSDNDNPENAVEQTFHRKKKKLKKKKKKKKKKKRKRHYWDKWSEWSPCSVTCGRGRRIRWRKCIAKNCKIGELEMGEKTCQLPACNLLTKLLGF